MGGGGARSAWRPSTARHFESLPAEAHSLGRQTAEIDLRRRLASGDPLGERVAIDLVRALAEAGDWAGALRQAREYEARVRAELPGAQVTDLMELGAAHGR